MNSRFVIAMASICGAFLSAQGTTAPLPSEPAALLSLAAKTNGLAAPGLAPWHLKLHYERTDSDTDVVDSGVYEEFWVSQAKYKREYESDGFTQTEFSNEHGVFRVGKQEGPGGWQLLLRSLVLEPVADIDPKENRFRRAGRKLGEDALECITFRSKASNVTVRVVGYAIAEPHYCFTSGTSILRFSSKGGGDQDVTYNDVVTFQGRSVARDIQMTMPDKSGLKIKVELLENVPGVDEAQFAPPSDAFGPIGATGLVVSGAEFNQLLVKRVYPDYPDSVRHLHYRGKYEIQITLGKDGRVLAVKAKGDTPEIEKAVEESFRRSQFRPYRLRGEATEVQSTFTMEVAIN